MTTEDPATLPPPGIDVLLTLHGATYSMASEAVHRRAVEGLDIGASWYRLGAS